MTYHAPPIISSDSNGGGKSYWGSHDSRLEKNKTIDDNKTIDEPNFTSDGFVEDESDKQDWDIIDIPDEKKNNIVVIIVVSLIGLIILGLAIYILKLYRR